MSNYQDALQNYTEVKDRVAEFYLRFPEGSLQFEFNGTMEIGGQTIIWGRAYAYRTPDDIRPGIGTAWEFVPGETPFTRGSELQNLETSAWGRAIGALNIGINGQGIATKEEVQAAKQRDPWSAPPDAHKTPVKADSSVFGVTYVGEQPKDRKVPLKGSTVSNMDRPASEKQVNYFKSLVYKAWEASGYKGKPTEEELVDFVNTITKSSFAKISDFTARVVSEILDDQANLQTNLMDWNKDARLWQSEVF